jgi:tetratricopeptide (TPR) repeat protein
MAWNVSPSNEETALLMEAGFIYRDSKRFREAREVFAGVGVMYPKSEVPEVALGTVSFQERDFDGAMQHYRRALQINPRSAFSYVHMGEAALFQMDKESARVHLKKALELDPRGEYGKTARSLLKLWDVVQFK